MAITDIQISEELQTNAPSIKYRGNEGPKSPKEKRMIMAKGMGYSDEEIMEYEQYRTGMQEGKPGYPILEIDDYFQQFGGGPAEVRGPILPSPEDPVNPFQPQPQGPTLPDRQMAAYGGIMGLDGRKRYGWGSKLRKLIPNELAKVAEVAAPFVAMAAPQFALPAALAGGLGSYDRTGNLMSGLKSGAMTYGLGALSPGLKGVRDMGPQSGIFTKQPFGGRFNISNLFKGETPVNTKVKGSSIYDNVEDLDQLQELGVNQMNVNETGPTGIMESIRGLIPESKLGQVALSGGALALGTALLGEPGEAISEIMDRGAGLDIEAIRAEVLDAYNDETGEKLLALRAKYPFLGNAADKNLKAEGGRIGYAFGKGVESLPVDQMQEIEGQMAGGGDRGWRAQMLAEELSEEQYGMEFYDLPQRKQMEVYQIALDMIDEQGMAQGGRIGRAEGGLMDLGGMEKDYRAEGGFVPIGAKEKADDVPARLSVNEFVFTADAVRNAGGGDIDKGAEVMENVMKNLEQGGQMSEESQGMQGAQQMFETSERLSEVI